MRTNKMSRITSISLIYDVKVDGHYGEFDGFEVKTEVDSYKVLIENGQSCCESWGYFDTNDNKDDFLGAMLLDVRTTDTILNSKRLETLEVSVEISECMFVDFITNRGTFQLAVYNSHNGYYGHSVLLLKNNDHVIDSGL